MGFSGDDDDSIITKYKDAGTDNFLKKPCGVLDIKYIIEDYLDR